MAEANITICHQVSTFRIVALCVFIPASCLCTCTFIFYLQGSTYKRKASKAERAKETPTLKDLDFLNDHPEVALT